MSERFPFETTSQPKNPPPSPDKKNTTSIDLHQAEPVLSENNFDPESELGKILKLPKNDRRQALSLWKEKYVEQRTSLASLQAGFISFVRKNPDATSDQLLEILNQSNEEHHFSKEQLEISRSAVKLYAQKHEIISAIRKKYPDDQELFEAVFGVRPYGKVKVETGPIALNFACTNRIDFARLRHFDEKRSAVIFSLLKGILGNRTMGATMNRNLLIPELNGAVILENSAENPEPNYGSIRKHEEQHAFMQLWNQIETSKDLAEIENDKAETTEKEILQRCKENIEWRLQDELLAFLKSGADERFIFDVMRQHYISNFIRKESLILQDELHDDSADVPESDIEKKSKTAEEIISHVVKSLKSDEFYNKLGQEIFDATFAYNALYHRLMIPHEEIAALLALEPITQWVKLKDRIVTQKESKAHHA